MAKKKKEEKKWTVKILNPQPVEEVNRRLTLAVISLMKQGQLTLPGYEMYFPKSN